MDDLDRALNRVTKWRSILTGRILGTKPITDSPTQGFRDLFDKVILLRVEVTALTGLMLEKRVFTEHELRDALTEAADNLSAMYALEWPGITATDDGIHIDLPLGAETLARKSPL